MLGYVQILQVLRENVDHARSRHEKAKAIFWSIAADPRQLPGVPSGRLQPDGSEKIRDAFEAEAEAREALLNAIHRFSDLLENDHHAISPDSRAHEVGQALSPAKSISSAGHA